MTDQPPAPPAAPRSAPEPARPRRVWRWLLVVSLALNLLFLGLIAGGALRMWRNPEGVRASTDNGIVWLWRALPAEDRRSLRAAERPAGPRPEGARGTARQARIAAELATIRTLLSAEPFDRAALERQLVAAREAQTARSAAALDRMLDRIAAMAPAQRAAMADRLAAQRLHRFDHGRAAD